MSDATGTVAADAAVAGAGVDVAGFAAVVAGAVFGAAGLATVVAGVFGAAGFAAVGGVFGAGVVVWANATVEAPSAHAIVKARIIERV